MHYSLGWIKSVGRRQPRDGYCELLKMSTSINFLSCLTNNALDLINKTPKKISCNVLKIWFLNIYHYSFIKYLFIIIKTKIRAETKFFLFTYFFLSLGNLYYNNNNMIESINVCWVLIKFRIYLHRTLQSTSSSALEILHLYYIFLCNCKRRYFKGTVSLISSDTIETFIW